jgi:hypothetical protein
MKRRTAPKTALLGAAALTLLGGGALAADAAHPTVVELFQSQGCSSCPPANANVIALSARPDILALSFQVTYWDQLGWKDTFGSPQNTARQWEYARALRHDNVWTPQVVVNGRTDVVGIQKAEILNAVVRADRGDSGPAVTVAAGRVTVTGAGPSRPAAVWLVRYDPNIVQVPIRRGENGGLTLPHKNVVRSLTRLGDWAGPAKTYALPAPAAGGLKSAILVQAGPGGPILAAARI